MSVILALVASVIAPEMTPHVVDVPHRGNTVRASYHPRVAVQVRQVGMAAPGGRSGTQRCVWTATITADRGLAQPASQHLSRTLLETRSIEGSRHGSCMIGRRAIREELAARMPELHSHLTAIAMNDRPVLTNELATTQAMARD